MFDRENMFSFKQEVTATAVSDDVVFVGKGDAGAGTPKMVEITTPAVTGGGSLVAELQHADDDAGTFETALAVNVSAAELAMGGAVKVFSLPVGLKDYLRLNYTVTGTVTGLVVSAGIIGLAGQTNR